MMKEEGYLKKVLDGGKITIPKEIRDNIKIEKGDMIFIEKEKILDKETIISSIKGKKTEELEETINDVYSSDGYNTITLSKVNWDTEKQRG